MMNAPIWQTEWFGNSLSTWFFTLLGLVLAYAVVLLLVRGVGARLRTMAQHRPGPLTHGIAAVASATRQSLLFLLVLAIAANFLHLPARLALWLPRIIALLAGIQIALWLSRVVAVAVLQFGQRHGQPQNAVIFGLLSWVGQAAVWTLLLLAALSNAGVNVTTFVASLGVGGIAIALAAQNVLGDLFASISIGLDKPFVVGEAIAFGDSSGTVTHVGIKSTRLVALSGEEIAISNTQLLNQRIRNYSRMHERLVILRFRIDNQTPRDKVERIVSGVRELMQADQRVRFDRGHFTGFGDWSLDFEFAFFMLSADYGKYMSTQQDFNLGIMQLLEQLQVPLAAPTRVIRDAAKMQAAA